MRCSAAPAIVAAFSVIACVGLFTSVPLSRVTRAERSAVQREIRPITSYELRDLYERRYRQIRSHQAVSWGGDVDLVTTVDGLEISPIDLVVLTKQQIEGARASLSYGDYHKLRRAVYKAQEPLARVVTQIGRRVAQASDRPDLSFTLEPSIAMNAGAVAGFNPTAIYVGPQLVMLAQSDDALAFILAHEVAHHRHGHTRALAIQNLLVGAVKVAVAIGVGVAMAASERRGGVRYSPELYRNSMSGAAVLAGAVVNGAIRLAGYGRDQEREADYYGLQYATRAGYNPDAADDILVRLMAHEQGLGSSLTVPFLSDHPSNAERVVRLRQWTVSLSTITAATEESVATPATMEPAVQRSTAPPMISSLPGVTETSDIDEFPSRETFSRMPTDQDTLSVEQTGRFCWQGIGLKGVICETCCEDGICVGNCEVTTITYAGNSVTRPAECWNSDAFDDSQHVLCTTCCTADVTCDTTCAKADRNEPYVR